MCYVDKKDIFLYMDKETEDKVAKSMQNFAQKKRYDLISEKEIPLNDKKDIFMQIIPTKHILKDGEYVLDESYAIKIILKENKEEKVVIGITSDTEYFKELSEAFYNCDYIIANISETSEEDYSQNAIKEKHLGYNGCLKLVEECNEKRKIESVHGTLVKNPRYIISEFWGGKGDVRRELVRRLRKDSGYEYIYPGDIGMMFFLDQPTFLCGLCGGEQDLEQLKIIRPGIEYSPLFNVCDECIL